MKKRASRPTKPQTAQSKKIRGANRGEAPAREAARIKRETAEYKAKFVRVEDVLTGALKLILAAKFEARYPALGVKIAGMSDSAEIEELLRRTSLECLQAVENEWRSMTGRFAARSAKPSSGG